MVKGNSNKIRISGKKRSTSKKSKKDILSSTKEERIHDLKLTQIQIEVQKQELMQQRDLLEISRDKYADLYDFAPVGYLTIDRHGIIREANLTASEILGIERKLIYKLSFINMLKTDETKRFVNDLKDCRIHNAQMIDEFTILNKKKGQLSVQINAIPVMDYETKKIAYRLSLIDITEKKKIMDELKESEERFRLMSDSSPAMIWMLDENNNLIYLNKKSENFYGKTLEDLEGNAWSQKTHRDDINKFKDTFSNAFKERFPFDIEIRRKNCKGEYRWIFNSAAPRFLKDGKFMGYIGIGIDVTEKHKLKDELENSLKEKEILFKEVHHRVKNNLQIISSILNLQTHFINNRPIDEILQACRHRVLSMSLIHEQLYHSKDLKNIDLRKYVKVLIDTLSSTYINESTNVKFILDLEDIFLDMETSINLGLIINELISNSLKYAFKGKEKGEIFVTLKHSNNGQKLVLKVSDNGIGLPESFDIHELKSLGFELVMSLVTQLRGELKISNNGKTEFQIII